MKLVKDGVIIVETNPNCISVWLRAGFAEYKKEPKKEKK